MPECWNTGSKPFYVPRRRAGKGEEVLCEERKPWESSVFSQRRRAEQISEQERARLQARGFQELRARAFLEGGRVQCCCRGKSAED